MSITKKLLSGNYCTFETMGAGIELLYPTGRGNARPFTGRKKGYSEIKKRVYDRGAAL
jgi:hypothetical protein